jgi:hypothetical protein
MSQLLFDEDMARTRQGHGSPDQRELGERGKFFFACIQCCFTATRSA